MRYSIEKLKSVVEQVNRAVEDKAELEVFREMKMSFYDGTTTLSGFMQGFAIEEAFGTPGTTTIPTITLSGKKLTDIINHLPGKECDISFDGTKVTIKAGRSRYVLPIARDRDYLEFRWPQGLELQRCQRKDLVIALKRCTAVADDKNKDRPEKAVVHFCENHVVSSDGVVMACQDNPGVFLIPNPINLSMAHASRILNVVKSAKHDECSYAFTDNVLYLMIDRLAMMATGVAVNFPPYEVVLRNHVPTVTFVVSRKRMLEEAGRLSVIGDLITMTIGKKGLTLHGIFDGSEVETFVECDIVIQDDMEIGFTLGALVRGLKTLTAENIQVEVIGPKRPVCFREALYGCYIVPRQF
jgi:DNA polymerase III sliding clamp (beta) subunit (PCNA family)